MITWKQRLSRIMGSFTMGAGAGLTISVMDQSHIQIFMFNCLVGGLMYAMPQIKCVFDDYGKARRI